MRIAFILCFVLLFARITTFGQTSLSERTGFWPQGSTWVGGVYPGTLSGGTITLNSKVVVINGTVKSIDDITLNFCNLSVNVGDTLVLLGNFTLAGTTFSNNGVVVVMGNFNNTLSNSSISGSGKLVVTGNYNNTLGANSFAGPSYVFGSTSGFIVPPAVGNEGSLSASDASLYNYVNTMYALMPVELVYFNAEVVNASVVLTWETASELNNDFFMVERLIEGEDKFETVATIRGAGISKNAIQYEYTDYSPLDGRSYYRLSQVDFDGTVTHFDIVSVVTERMALKVYPNPTTEYLFLLGAKMNSTISVNDIQHGNQLRQFEVQELLPGQLGIDVRDLDSGVYSVIVIGENSEEHLKFVKQ